MDATEYTAVKKDFAIVDSYLKAIVKTNSNLYVQDGYLCMSGEVFYVVAKYTTNDALQGMYLSYNEAQDTYLFNCIAYVALLCGFAYGDIKAKLGISVANSASSIKKINREIDL